jgi:hypothetical protein
MAPLGGATIGETISIHPSSDGAYYVMALNQGSTLTVVRLPGTSENPVRTSET